ncbi:uncharacterized protein MYCFIDRAFT_178898 [Pseudocercospora fijiensis CIRAD86]|uniref:Uncharacterized protein n=1 Tax=Pseudocercospora fijiensis (strain CIRAD86) TaxID=383855 RepID=M3AMY5_PSEFD|nr:uncharacterized protein MYCFIDRAFT_178898 [Pseudocercospora fijiensis CIRAD86]EME78797.1 hypothetical protein MYCFIDRAFT_178898 [Pseudocercospora fijiensis CIRAD86]
MLSSADVEVDHRREAGYKLLSLTLASHSCLKARLSARLTATEMPSEMIYSPIRFVAYKWEQYHHYLQHDLVLCSRCFVTAAEACRCACMFDVLPRGRWGARRVKRFSGTRIA